MELKQEISIHNRWDVEVVDSVSGKVRQKAEGFNVICNGYFSLLLMKTQMKFMLGRIAFGSGSGTPSITDTAMFTPIDRKTAETIETVYAYPTSHITKRITLTSEEYVGRTITEVGFNDHWYNSTSVLDSNTLLTHAMLQDSEGNPIAITKTDTDTVYITGTLYCTFTPGGFGDNGVYPDPSSNIIFRWVFGEYFFRNRTMDHPLRACQYNITRANELNSYYAKSKSYTLCSGIEQGNTSLLTMTYPNMAVLETDITPNNYSVKSFGMPGLGAFNFPDPSILPGYQITNQTIGTGDGVTKSFDFSAPFIKRGSVSVWVDDTLQVEDVDYVVDYESNCKDEFCNYYSSGLSVINTPDQVRFGDMAERAVSSSSFNDPFAWYMLNGNANKLPSSCQITQAKPIWIDFTEEKACNTLKFANWITVPAAQRDNMVIEYSSDGINWTALTYTRSEQVYSFEMTSAQYWKCYISGYTWSVNMNTSSYTYDGITTRGAFLLGKKNNSITFTEAPAADAVITASYQLTVPFKTANNILRLTIVIQFQRG